ncbi:MAG: 3-phosphoserine/phosphohydroxythreonine transaminase [Sedimentisphaerales bacterium]|nr:3-phosphoserine/phosphohydroxythreonine transaminase [Sedimentisphaerales bacterium]
MARKINFYAGPSALPVEALEAARGEMLDFAGSGVGVMETSHRSKEYDAVHNETIALIKELIGLGDNYHVLFLQGGASLQFAMVPMNLLGSGASADYVVTGSWSKKALKEAKIIASAKVAATTEIGKDVFRAIPKPADLKLDPSAVYCHITSNNTIYGTQWRQFPNIGNVPLVADMSSDILSRQFDPKPFGLIYAGAQKNLGPAGVTVVIIRDDILAKCRDGLPTMLTYKTHADNNSLFNTPTTFSIYVMNKVLHWLKGKGGVAAMEKENTAKAKLLYDAIDNSGGFYTNTIAPEDRSHMNFVFNLPSEELEKQFNAEGQKAGFLGLKGHRSIGGIRVSAYNVNGMDSVKAITSFMSDFMAKNG